MELESRAKLHGGKEGIAIDYVGTKENADC